MFGYRTGSILRRCLLLLAAVTVAGVAWAARPSDDPRTAGQPFTGSLAGKLLVAAPSMADPRFRQSVVLMVSHTAEGALGLIVNKPMGELDTAKLYDRMGLDHKGPNRQLTVHFGGPVEPQYSFVIHGADFAAPETQKVSDKLFVTPESVVIAAMSREVGPAQAIFVVGYAGWGPSQLEGEMKRDDWVIAPADSSLVLGPNHDGKWQRAMELRYRSL